MVRVCVCEQWPSSGERVLLLQEHAQVLQPQLRRAFHHRTHRELGVISVAHVGAVQILHPDPLLEAEEWAVHASDLESGPDEPHEAPVFAHERPLDRTLHGAMRGGKALAIVVQLALQMALQHPLDGTHFACLRDVEVAPVRIVVAHDDHAFRDGPAVAHDSSLRMRAIADPQHNANR